jgi:hypothetical protein
MCVTVSWGAHESFMHPIFVLKNGCDNFLGGLWWQLMKVLGCFVLALEEIFSTQGNLGL